MIPDRDYRVAGYATLSMSGIDYSAAPLRMRRDAADPVPALLVGRLAVDEAFAGLGVGTALVRHLLATAVELNLNAACRAVVVNALNDSAKSWWLSLGFTPFDNAGFDLHRVTTRGSFSVCRTGTMWSKSGNQTWSKVVPQRRLLRHSRIRGHSYLVQRSDEGIDVTATE